MIIITQTNDHGVRTCQTVYLTIPDTRNLAIPNRSCVSCAHITSRASIVTLTLKSRLAVTQGHWKWYHLQTWIRFPISIP